MPVSKKTFKTVKDAKGYLIRYFPVASLTDIFIDELKKEATE